MRNEWTAPWLWSVVEVIERCKDLPVEFTQIQPEEVLNEVPTIVIFVTKNIR